MDKRVNGLGVSESTLQTIGDDQLLLELPGEQDPSRAAKVLGETALLEFRAQKSGTKEEMRSLKNLRFQIRSLLAFVKINGDSLTSQDIDINKKDLEDFEKDFGFKIDFLT